jgi:hypothetical protein
VHNQPDDVLRPCFFNCKFGVVEHSVLVVTRVCPQLLQ